MVKRASGVLKLTVQNKFLFFRIWDYLTELATKGTTVIITTHYIDETKQANKVKKNRFLL